MSDENNPRISEDDEQEEIDVVALLDLTNKKKKKKGDKKKKKNKVTSLSESTDVIKSFPGLVEHKVMLLEQDEAQEVLEDPFDCKANYTYQELLDKMMKELYEHNPELVEKHKRCLLYTSPSPRD